ncbi:uridine kinase [Streptomyces sp. NPDC059816]|uniref:uridine kinase family protein n=1 Tax=Streptomyces sp. NPDC059816 TaxID=3346960 RepID=UPI00365E4AF2
MTAPTPAPRAASAAVRRLAADLALLPPSCGPVRLIAVDGHAGSGKTTFAAVLAEALDGAPVLHLDDFATHTELFAWTDRLLRQVITPLGRGEPARYAPYDWNARAFGAPRSLAPAPVVLLEGVGAGRRDLRPELARVLWMEYERGAAWERGRRRDGPAQHSFWERWVAAEQEHFAGDPTLPFADLVVRQGTLGYEVSAGPASTGGPTEAVGTSRPHQSVTEREAQ